MARVLTKYELFDKYRGLFESGLCVALAAYLTDVKLAGCPGWQVMRGLHSAFSFPPYGF